ncbi:uncharacterized protein METZ01_LOCUS507962 [marine metagenome]|uniref:Uncharacterized protein n=1 Tax=marine metagenome TaxID=408172 RepID=A0A383EG75_9ZZZZ
MTKIVSIINICGVFNYKKNTSKSKFFMLYGYLYYISLGRSISQLV